MSPNLLASICLSAALAFCGCTSIPPAPSATAAAGTSSPSAAPPTPTPTPLTSPPSAPPPTVGRLDEALAHLRADVSYFTFNDWLGLKTSLGLLGVTGASSEEEKRAALSLFIPTPGEGQTGPPRPPLEHVNGDGYGIRNLLRHNEVWGFDAWDYDWDMTMSMSDGAVHVLRFRPDFDFTPLSARFDERGFETEQVGAATIRTHALDLAADWLLGELAILNVAYFDDGRTLVLAANPDVLRGYLASAVVEVPDHVRVTAAALGEPSAAQMLLGGTSWCGVIEESLAGTAPEVRAGMEAVAADAGSISTWDAFGVGYSRAREPIGRLAFGYADPTAAAGDLSAREILAREGLSVEGGAPYSEQIFTLENSSRAGGAVTLEVAPVGDSPPRLFQMIPRRDLFLALCAPLAPAD